MGMEGRQYEFNLGRDLGSKPQPEVPAQNGASGASAIEQIPKKGPETNPTKCKVSVIERDARVKWGDETLVVDNKRWLGAGGQYEVSLRDAAGNIRKVPLDRDEDLDVLTA